MIYTVNVEPTRRTYTMKKAKRKIAQIDRDRNACKKCRIKLRRIIAPALKAMAENLAKQISAHINKADKSEIDRIIQALNLDEFVAMYGEIDDALAAIATDGGAQALIQIGINDNQGLTDQVNEKAVAWAKQHSASMVGKKWIDGELVDNPSAAWSILKSTREMIRADVADAIDNGWSNDTLAAKLADSYAFSDDRAEMIARTETATADIQGNVEAYQASGLVSGKEWITADDDQVSEDCQANADDGVIPFEDAFTSGAMFPPEHPNCRCDVVPDLIDDNQEE